MHHLSKNLIDCINQLIVQQCACSLESDCAVVSVMLWAQSFGDGDVLQVVLQFVLQKANRSFNSNLACVDCNAADANALEAEVCLNVLHNVCNFGLLKGFSMNDSRTNQ
jgi:hypothetical protein